MVPTFIAEYRDDILERKEFTMHVPYRLSRSRRREQRGTNPMADANKLQIAREVAWKTEKANASFAEGIFFFGSARPAAQKYLLDEKTISIEKPRYRGSIQRETFNRNRTAIVLRLPSV